MELSRPDPKRWLALALLCAAQFIVILDTSIIGVALPMTVMIMVVMVGFSGRLIGRFGPKAKLIIGLLLMGAALLLFANLPPEGSFWVNVLPASLLAALGMGFAYIPATMSGMSGAKPEETGLGLVPTSSRIEQGARSHLEVA